MCYPWKPFTRVRPGDIQVQHITCACLAPLRLLSSGFQVLMSSQLIRGGPSQRQHACHFSANNFPREPFRVFCSSHSSRHGPHSTSCESYWKRGPKVRDTLPRGAAESKLLGKRILHSGGVSHKHRRRSSDGGSRRRLQGRVQL